MGWIRKWLPRGAQSAAPVRETVASISPVVATAPAVDVQPTAQGTSIRFTECATANNLVQCISVDALMERVEPLILGLYHEIGWSRPDFDRLIRPMIRRYAQYVHLAPASETHHHSRLGGLLVHGLEVAIEAARLSREQVVDLGKTFLLDVNLRVMRRKVWPLAAAAGGLLHDLGKILVDILVSRTDTGAVWNPYLEPISDWIRREGVQEVAIAWRAGRRHHRHEPFGLVLVHPLLGAELLGLVNEHGRDIFEGLIRGAIEDDDDVTGIGSIVREADATSVRRDRDSQRQRWREGAVGGHPIVNRFLEACQGLLADGTWVANQPGSPLWVASEGLYLIWNAAVSHAIGWMRQHGTGTIPHELDALAEFLVDAQIARPRLLANNEIDRTWSIRIPAPSGMNVIGVAQAIFIPDPNVLFSGRAVPQPVVIEVMPDPTAIVVAHAPVAEAHGAPPANNPDLFSGAPQEAPSGERTNETHAAPPPVTMIAASVPRRPAEKRAIEASTLAAAEPAPMVAPTPKRRDDGPSFEDAEVYFASLGVTGAVLLQLLKAYREDPDRYATLMVYRERKLVLRWPEAVTGHGATVADLVTHLKENSKLLASHYGGVSIDPCRGSLVIRAEVTKDAPWNALVLSEEVTRYAFVIGDPRPVWDAKLRLAFARWCLERPEVADQPAGAVISAYAKDAKKKVDVVMGAALIAPALVVGVDGSARDQRIDLATVAALVADGQESRA